MHGGRFAESIRGMTLTAKHAGYDLLATMTTLEDLGMALNNAAARLVDGVVLHAPSLRINDAELLTLCNGMPLVRRDYVPASRLAWVGFDQAYATRTAVEHLIELGHRQIAALPPSLNLINGLWRDSIWRETLLKHGLELGPCCDGHNTHQGGYDAMQQVLASGVHFTAIMAGSDTMAFGALHALREHGLHVPDDISIVSFDNADTATFTDPPLTTVSFDFREQDATAVKYLVEILNNPDMKLHQRILLPDLIVRSSTRKLDTIGTIPSPAGLIEQKEWAPLTIDQ
jgi:LacI family transcriptional regulator